MQSFIKMQGDKNSKINRSAQRGIQCERHALKYYLKQGYRLLHARLHTRYAEVDLVLMGNSGEILLVEVKSIGNEDFLIYRLGTGQKKRLLRVLASYAESYQNVRIEMIAVNRKGEVFVVPEVFLS